MKLFSENFAVTAITCLRMRTKFNFLDTAAEKKCQNGDSNYPHVRTSKQCQVKTKLSK